MTFRSHLHLVGALTSKPYAFTARSWELKNTDSLDVFDSVGSNIKISTRGSSVLRVLPKINEKVNEEWITDKARFSYDALKFQRILHCYKKYNGRFAKINWFKVFGLLSARSAEKEFYPLGKKFSQPNLNVFVGAFSDLETLNFVKNFQFLLKNSGFSVINTAFPSSQLNLDLRSTFLFRNIWGEIDGLETLLLVGCNPRLEAPALNLKIRKAVLFRNLRVFNLGFSAPLTYRVTNLGSGVKKLLALIEGRSRAARYFFKAYRSLIVCGSSFLQTENAGSLYHHLHSWFGNVTLLAGEASAVNYCELGFASQKSFCSTTTTTATQINWLLDEDKSLFLGKNRFNIYLGHHGDLNFQKSDLILPSTLFSEKNSIYLNYEGYLQKTKFVDSSMLGKDVRDDLVFMKTFLKKQDRPLPFYHRTGQQLISYQPCRTAQTPNPYFYVSNHSLFYYMKDFYRNDSISRNSPIMALTSNRLNFRKSSYHR